MLKFYESDKNDIIEMARGVAVDNIMDYEMTGLERNIVYNDGLFSSYIESDFSEKYNELNNKIRILQSKITSIQKLQQTLSGDAVSFYVEYSDHCYKRSYSLLKSIRVTKKKIVNISKQILELYNSDVTKTDTQKNYLSTYSKFLKDRIIYYNSMEQYYKANMNTYLEVNKLLSMDENELKQQANEFSSTALSAMDIELHNLKLTLSNAKDELNELKQALAFIRENLYNKIM